MKENGTKSLYSPVIHRKFVFTLNELSRARYKITLYEPILSILVYNFYFSPHFFLLVFNYPTLDSKFILPILVLYSLFDIRKHSSEAIRSIIKISSCVLKKGVAFLKKWVTRSNYCHQFLLFHLWEGTWYVSYHFTVKTDAIYPWWLQKRYFLIEEGKNVWFRLQIQFVFNIIFESNCPTPLLVLDASVNLSIAWKGNLVAV